MKYSLLNPQIFLALDVFLFLNAFFTSSAYADLLGVEKDVLSLGFITLIDGTPLAIVYEKDFFEDEGLDVTLKPQTT